jgi:signal transduction histidine kinase
MRRIVAIVGCFMLVLCIFSKAFADQETEVKELVNKALATFSEKGMDYTVKLINSPSGPFRKGELYVFAMSFDGKILAHSANKDLVGKNQADFKDAKGELIFPPMLDAAEKSGEGWTEYWWMRHGEKEPSLKRTFVKRIPGEKMFLAGGYYVGK